MSFRHINLRLFADATGCVPTIKLKTDKAASKQEQSYACINYAEREQVRGNNFPQLKTNIVLQYEKK